MKNHGRRKLRIRSKIMKLTDRDRLTVHRSNQHIYTQIVDKKGNVIASASDKDIDTKEKMTKTQKAKSVGKLVAERAVAKKIKTIVFDRSGYKYHGRVKALAEGAREGGLDF